MVDKGDEATESESSSPQNLQQWNAYEDLTGSSVSSFRSQYSAEINEPTNWYGMPAPPPESARDTSAKVTKLIQEVLSTYEDVLAKRYRIREMRHMLRQKRDQEDDVRVTINDLQVATASCFIFENDYYRQEDELAQVEYDYNRRLETLQAILKYEGHLLAQIEPIISNTESSSSDYTSEYGDQMVPQVADYLSMVGEVRILTERLSELETYYQVLVDQRELRERVGIPLDSGALNFLLRYPDKKSKIETELELARHNVEAHPEHVYRSAQIAQEEDKEMR
ncbi:hypothetical protein PEXP_044840 [Penicillium expansum]|nr:hypothetical protein PEXP_044840 [Penicillium expansum]